jgi:hypothetical protein
MRTLSIAVRRRTLSGVVGALLLVGAYFMATPATATAAEEQGERSCVCTEGAGGCWGYTRFCCNFTSSGYTCGCSLFVVGC